MFPRKNTERNRALFFYNNHFFPIWKSDSVSFNNTVEELKSKIKTVANM